MRFWFSKMLWGSNVEITWNIKESIQEPTRELIQCLVSWKTIFTEKQNKNCSSGRSNISTRKQVEIYRSKYMWSRKKQYLCQESYSGEK